MASELSHVIIGSGSVIPTRRIPNSYFYDHMFYDPDGTPITYGSGDKKGQIKPTPEIVKTFEGITGIEERRYVTDDLTTSKIGYLAAVEALEDSGIDRETLRYIVFAHNFGDVRADNRRSDFVPTLAARVKHQLGIENPFTVAYDLPFGCPGWLEGFIHLDDRLKEGETGLVIGAETLSRVAPPGDMDAMIYADGAGATVSQKRRTETKEGVLSHVTRSDTLDHAYMLWMGRSRVPGDERTELGLTMRGHDLYIYAQKNVAKTGKMAMDQAGIGIQDLTKVLLHQANDKLDYNIVDKFFKLYGIKPTEKQVRDIMPMTISWLGNPSVASIPTLYDLIQKNKLNNHMLKSGDHVLFASVGAGMNINALVYLVP